MLRKTNLQTEILAAFHKTTLDRTGEILFVFGRASRCGSAASKSRWRERADFHQCLWRHRNKSPPQLYSAPVPPLQSLCPIASSHHLCTRLTLLGWHWFREFITSEAISQALFWPSPQRMVFVCKVFAQACQLIRRHDALPISQVLIGCSLFLLHMWYSRSSGTFSWAARCGQFSLWRITNISLHQALRTTRNWNYLIYYTSGISMNSEDSTS